MSVCERLCLCVMTYVDTHTQVRGQLCGLWLLIEELMLPGNGIYVLEIYFLIRQKKAFKKNKAMEGCFLLP